VISLSFVLGSTIHHWVTENEQRWVRQAFSRYVSPNRVAHLVEHHDQLELGGQRQVCSFVFTDLADFTRLMESGDPAAAVTQLNEYLDGMLAIVFKHEGTVDRIVGDAVAVLFSAPVAQPDHQQRAMNCALDMERFAASYAEKLQATGVKWGHTRIGIHCGEVIVGNFGGKTLFDYRALGDPINTASRLESVNKHLGTRMCASADLLKGCTGIEARLVGKLVLQGKVKPLEVWEPLTAKQKERYAPTEQYQAAMALLTGEPSESESALKSMSAFRALAEQYPEDPLVKLHFQRLQQSATDDLIVMQSK
jgi:adenylate cyclase